MRRPGGGRLKQFGVGVLTGLGLAVLSWFVVLKPQLDRELEAAYVVRDSAVAVADSTNQALASFRLQTSATVASARAETKESEERARGWEVQAQAERDSRRRHEAALRATLDSAQAVMLDSATTHQDAALAAKDSVIAEKDLTIELARAEARAFEHLAAEERERGDRWEASYRAARHVSDLLEVKLRPSLLHELAIGIPAGAGCGVAAATQGTTSDAVLVGGTCLAGYAASRWLSRR